MYWCVPIFLEDMNYIDITFSIWCFLFANVLKHHLQWSYFCIKPKICDYVISISFCQCFCVHFSSHSLVLFLTQQMKLILQHSPSPLPSNTFTHVLFVSDIHAVQLIPIPPHHHNTHFSDRKWEKRTKRQKQQCVCRILCPNIVTDDAWSIQPFEMCASENIERNIIRKNISEKRGFILISGSSLNYMCICVSECVGVCLFTQWERRIFLYEE